MLQVLRLVMEEEPSWSVSDFLLLFFLVQELQEASNSLNGGHFRSPAVREAEEGGAAAAPSSGVFGWKLPSLLSRTRSAS